MLTLSNIGHQHGRQSDQATLSCLAARRLSHLKVMVHMLHSAVLCHESAGGQEVHKLALSCAAP